MRRAKKQAAEAALSQRAPKKSSDARQGGHDQELISLLWNVRSQFRDLRDINRLIRAALKLALSHFGCDEGCVVTTKAGRFEADVDVSIPAANDWDRTFLGQFLRGAKVTVPGQMMLARLRRRGRMFGALVLRSGSREFGWGDRQSFSLIGEFVNEFIELIEQVRISEVRAQIDRKVLEQARPKDLFYKLLHGIRSLTEYDHSSAILICDAEQGLLEIVAEQVAWQKGKSVNVGLTLPVDGRLRELLRKNRAFGFDRTDGVWKQWTGDEALELAELLDYNPRHPTESFPAAENSILCLPLATKEGLIGALKVASIHSAALRQCEVDLLAQFLPQASVALRNLRRTESLESQVLAAERKYAMANLARGVAHDVNNALGAVLPLIQQLQQELTQGDFDAEVAAADLLQIERSVKMCRRIFGGMLHFARNASRNASEVSLYDVVEAAVGIFRQSLERRNISLSVDLPTGLPSLTAVQADLEQLVLNLVSNARDAVSPGNSISIKAALLPNGHGVKLTISDTGCGIPEEFLSRIEEPFFTTKKTGNGLGLAICRSIVSQLRGSLAIQSVLGKGTTVIVTIHVEETTTA